MRKRHVVHQLAPVYGFRDHQLLIFRPIKFRGKGVRSGSFGRRDGPCRHQCTSHGQNVFQRWQLCLVLAGPQQLIESVSGGQYHFCKTHAVRFRHFWRQYIFNFVREAANRREAARGGITFQRMHSATHAAKYFFVSRTSFQFETRLIQRLQYFAGTFKKESTQFGGPIVWQIVHEPTSSR